MLFNEIVREANYSFIKGKQILNVAYKKVYLSNACFKPSSVYGGEGFYFTIHKVELIKTALSLAFSHNQDNEKLIT